MVRKFLKGLGMQLGLLLLCILFFMAGRFTTRAEAHQEQPASGEAGETKAQSEPAQAETKEQPWNLMLINYENEIPEDYLVTLKKLANGQAVDERIYPELQQMMDDARAAGLNPTIISSYRTREKQQSLYNNKVERCMAEGYSREEAEKLAAEWVAVPDTSEHQAGFAVDIVSKSHPDLDSSQEKTREQQWLMKNCWKYGFILRYPSDKSEITRIGYEPWHYRYVGKEAAKEIMLQGICLEEYLRANSEKA